MRRPVQTPSRAPHVQAAIAAAQAKPIGPRQVSPARAPHVAAAGSAHAPPARPVAGPRTHSRPQLGPSPDIMQPLSWSGIAAAWKGLSLGTQVGLAAGALYATDWLFGSPVHRWAYSTFQRPARKNRLIVGCGHARDGVNTAIHPQHQVDQDLMDLDGTMNPDIEADFLGDLSWEIDPGTYTDVFFENVPVTLVTGAQGGRAMRNAYRILRAGGTVRITTGLPPLYAVALLAELQNNVGNAHLTNFQSQNLANNGLLATAQK